MVGEGGAKSIDGVEEEEVESSKMIQREENEFCDALSPTEGGGEDILKEALSWGEEDRRGGMGADSDSPRGEEMAVEESHGEEGPGEGGEGGAAKMDLDNGRGRGGVDEQGVRVSPRESLREREKSPLEPEAAERNHDPLVTCAAGVICVFRGWGGRTSFLSVS